MCRGVGFICLNQFLIIYYDVEGETEGWWVAAAAAAVVMVVMVEGRTSFLTHCVLSERDGRGGD